MNKNAIVVLLIAALVLATSVDLRARGLGSSLGFSGGGARPSIGLSGGGMVRPSARPSAPSLSRPSQPSFSRPSIGQRPTTSLPGRLPSGGTTRPSIPSTGNRPNFGGGARPNLPTTGNRPNIGGTRPSIPSIGTLPGFGGSTRPSIRPGFGNQPGGIERPSQLPNRPGLGTLPGSNTRPVPGVRPGIPERPAIPDRPSQLPSRPGTGTLPGIGNRPGFGIRPPVERPSQLPSLPGLGNRPEFGGRPGIGYRPGFGIGPSRPPLNDRVDGIRDRLANRPMPLPATPHDRWRDWYNQYHGKWHHGHWHGTWRPGNYWGYWWSNYPVLTTFGLTAWTLNRTGWAFGYCNYYNPYAGAVVIDNSVYDYSQPLVMLPGESALSGDPQDTSPPPDVPPEAFTAFDQARRDFYAADYEAALNSTDKALKEIPTDAVIHEFRALTLFALGKYQDAAATLYAVLSVGPGWDWTTMYGLYPNADDYTEQLRALESYCTTNRNDPAARFVLGYHYLTMGHEPEAAEQFKTVLSITPDDQLAAQLLLQVDPQAELPQAAKRVEPPKPQIKVEESQLEGAWTATRGTNTFSMNLKNDNTFLWTYATGGQPQEVSGVWGVDEDGILALEMNDQDVMLAQVIPQANTLDFYMLGDTTGAEPLKFSK